MRKFLGVALVGLVELACAASPTSVVATFQETSVGQPAPTVTSHSWDVSNSTKDRQIWPVKFLLEAGDPFYPKGSEKFNVTCQDCSASGKVDMSIGGFASANNGSELVYNWLTDGYIKFTLNGFHVNYTMKVDTLPGFTNASIYIPVFDSELADWRLSADQSASILGYGVPMGYYFNLRTNQTASFTTRLSVRVPDGAYILMDLRKPESSYFRGFSGADVTTNFDIGNDLPEFTLSHGINVDWTGDQLSINNQSTGDDLFAYMGGTLPTVNSTFKRVQHVDTNCNPATDGKGMDSAVRVESTASFLGYFAAQGIASYGNSSTLLDINFITGNADGTFDSAMHNVTLPEDNFTIPSLCYSGNSGSGTLKLTNDGGSSGGQALARPTWLLVAAAVIPAFLHWVA